MILLFSVRNLTGLNYYIRTPPMPVFLVPPELNCVYMQIWLETASMRERR